MTLITYDRITRLCGLVMLADVIIADRYHQYTWWCIGVAIITGIVLIGTYFRFTWEINHDDT